MKKKNGFLLLECLYANALFIIFVGSFVAFSGHIFKAHQQSAQRLRSLEAMLVRIEGGGNVPEIVEEPVSVSLVLQLGDRCVIDSVIKATRCAHERRQLFSIVYKKH